MTAVWYKLGRGKKGVPICPSSHPDEWPGCLSGAVSPLTLIVEVYQNVTTLVEDLTIQKFEALGFYFYSIVS